MCLDHRLPEGNQSPQWARKGWSRGAVCPSSSGAVGGAILGTFGLLAIRASQLLPVVFRAPSTPLDLLRWQKRLDQGAGSYTYWGARHRCPRCQKHGCPQWSWKGSGGHPEGLCDNTFLQERLRQWPAFLQIRFCSNHSFLSSLDYNKDVFPVLLASLGKN